MTSLRVAALSHEALGTSRVKVIFREGGHSSQGKETAYFMDAEDYRAIPLLENATVEDYRKIAKASGRTVDEAQNLDIYSNK